MNSVTNLWVNYYIYYDPVRELQEIDNFYSRLMEIESRIIGIEYSDAISIIDEHYRGFDRLIEMKIENGRVKEIKRKRNAISQSKQERKNDHAHEHRNGLVNVSRSLQI
jgi:hypothetical protein